MANSNHSAEAHLSSKNYPEAKKILYTNLLHIGPCATDQIMVAKFFTKELSCLYRSTILRNRCGYMFAIDALVTLKSISVNKKADITFGYDHGRLVATFKSKGCPDEVRYIGQTSTHTFFMVRFGQGNCRVILDWNEAGVDGTSIGTCIANEMKTTRFVPTLSNANKVPMHQQSHAPPVQLTLAEQLTTSPSYNSHSDENARSNVNTLVVEDIAADQTRNNTLPKLNSPTSYVLISKMISTNMIERAVPKHFTNVFLLVPEDNHSLRNCIWNGLKVYRSLVSDDTVLARFSLDPCNIITIMAIAYGEDLLKIRRVASHDNIIFCGYSESAEHYVLSELLDGAKQFKLQDPFLDDKAWPTRTKKKNEICRKSAGILDMIQKHNKLNECYALMIPPNADSVTMRDTLFKLVVRCAPTPITPELLNCWKSNCLEGSTKRRVDEFLDWYGITPEIKAGLDSGEVLVRSVTLDKSSRMIFLLGCYTPALQPTTGNRVPYEFMSHFFTDKDPVRQGAMFAMLANSALMIEDVKTATQYKQEAAKCLCEAVYPHQYNMDYYVSALIDIGTYHQACFEFDAALELYRKIKSYADKYPHLFFGQQHSFVHQPGRFVDVTTRQENELYPGRFIEIRNVTSDAHNSTHQAPQSTVANDDISVVPTYALPKTPEEAMSFHLGYTYVALTLLTSGDELKGIQKEIRDSNLAKLGSHRLFYEVSEMLRNMSKIATLYLFTQAQMDFNWFQADLEYAYSKMNGVDLGRRIFLYGQFKLAQIHGLMAANMRIEATKTLQHLVSFALDQFHYGKTNVLGFIYLFSACVCYKHLNLPALFNETIGRVASFILPGLPLAERCVLEIRKFDANQIDDIAPYFAKLAAILQNSETVVLGSQVITYSSKWAIQEKYRIHETLLNFKGPIYARNGFGNTNNNSPAPADRLTPGELHADGNSYSSQESFMRAMEGPEISMVEEKINMYDGLAPHQLANTQPEIYQNNSLGNFHVVDYELLSLPNEEAEDRRCA